MLSARIDALVVKDLRLHGRSIVGAQVGVLLMGAAAVAMRPDGSASVLAALIFNINILLAGFWGDWFVSREKLKGTVAWLRSLPVTDFDLVTSKLVAHAVCTVPLWVVSSVVFLKDFYFPHRVGTWVVLQLALLTFGALSLGSRWRFHQKVGQVLPFALVAVTGAVVFMAERLGIGVRAYASGLWEQTTGKAAAGAALATCYVLVWRLTVGWMRRSETVQLLE